MKLPLLSFALLITSVSCSEKAGPGPISPPADDVVTLHVVAKNVTGRPFSAKLVMSGASALTGKVMMADPTLQLEEVYREDVDKIISVGTFRPYSKDKVGGFMVDMISASTLDYYGSSATTASTSATFSVQWLVNGQPVVFPPAYSGYPTKTVLSANTSTTHTQALAYWANYFKP